jgi:hypothetical protein
MGGRNAHWRAAVVTQHDSAPLRPYDRIYHRFRRQRARYDSPAGGFGRNGTFAVRRPAAPYLRRNVLAELAASEMKPEQAGRDERQAKERRTRFRQSRNIKLDTLRTWLISRLLSKPLE